LFAFYQVHQRAGDGGYGKHKQNKNDDFLTIAPHRPYDDQARFDVATELEYPEYS